MARVRRCSGKYRCNRESSSSGTTSDFSLESRYPSLALPMVCGVASPIAIDCAPGSVWRAAIHCKVLRPTPARSADRRVALAEPSSPCATCKGGWRGSSLNRVATTRRRLIRRPQDRRVVSSRASESPRTTHPSITSQLNSRPQTRSRRWRRPEPTPARRRKAVEAAGRGQPTPPREPRQRGGWHRVDAPPCHRDRCLDRSRCLRMDQEHRDPNADLDGTKEIDFDATCRNARYHK